MIKSIEIKNFQSHKKTKLELHPGVNIIVGSTDCGKSAIIRALRWVIKNRPSGDSFRSHWGGDTKVIVETAEGSVSRVKGDNLNSYIVNGEELKSFGTSVPDEVSELLNLDDVNIENQFDSHFLLSSSPGEVAQYFNKIANLSLIDSAISFLKSWLRKKEADFTRYKDNYKQQKEDLAKYENLPEHEELLENIEKLEEKQQFLIKRQSSLQSLVDSIENVQTEIKDKAQIIEYEKDVDAILELIDSKDMIEIQRDKLKGLASDIQVNKDKLTQLRSFIGIESVVNEALNLISALKEKKQKRSELSELLDEMSKTTHTLKKTEEKVLKLSDEFQESFPDVCPLCGDVVCKKCNKK